MLTLLIVYFVGGNTKGLGRIADGVEQCLHAAREELRQGADFIKIMASGGVVSPTDKLTSLQYTPEEIRAFTKVASDSDTYVTAHAYTPDAIQNAVSNGVMVRILMGVTLLRLSNADAASAWSFHCLEHTP